MERVGAECESLDIPFFLEPVAYSSRIPDTKGADYAKVKPDKVKAYMEEFSKSRYKVDVLKAEVPVNLQYVEGVQVNEGNPVVYSHTEALSIMRDVSAVCRIPFIYLSGGVSNAVFRESLQLAADAGTGFCGVLCGRATWQGGIREYGKSGVKGLKRWLQEEGVSNIQALNKTLHQTARPWWDVYGGKESIQTTFG